MGAGKSSSSAAEGGFHFEPSFPAYGSIKNRWACLCCVCGTTDCSGIESFSVLRNKTECLCISQAFQAECFRCMDQNYQACCAIESGTFALDHRQGGMTLCDCGTKGTLACCCNLGEGCIVDMPTTLCANICQVAFCHLRVAIPCGDHVQAEIAICDKQIYKM